MSSMIYGVYLSLSRRLPTHMYIHVAIFLHNDCDLSSPNRTNRVYGAG